MYVYVRVYIVSELIKLQTHWIITPKYFLKDKVTLLQRSKHLSQEINIDIILSEGKFLK